MVINFDICVIQMVKVVFYFGVCFLMDKFGVDIVDCVIFVGVFGVYILVKYVMVLGMIFDCIIDKVMSVGNVVGIGVCIVLLNIDVCCEIEEIVCKIEKIEIVVELCF